MLARRRPGECVTLIPAAVVMVTHLVAIAAERLRSPDGRGDPVTSTTSTPHRVGVVTSPSSGPPWSVATATDAASNGWA